MPAIQTLDPSVRRDYLNKYYLPKLQEDRQPQDVLKRVTMAALGDGGKGLYGGSASKVRPPREHSSPRGSDSSRRKHSSSNNLPTLQRSASEPQGSMRRMPGSMAVPTESGRYGSLWLAPHITSSQYGVAKDPPRQAHAGPQRMWGPVAQMSMALERSHSHAGSANTSQRGSGKIRFSESCGRTPSESCGRTPSVSSFREPSCR